MPYIIGLVSLFASGALFRLTYVKLQWVQDRGRPDPRGLLYLVVGFVAFLGGMRLCLDGSASGLVGFFGHAAVAAAGWVVAAVVPVLLAVRKQLRQASSRELWSE